jgi:hypothetical protein
VDYLACFVGCLVEAVTDDCWVDAFLQQLLRLLQQSAADHHNRGGAITSNNILYTPAEAQEAIKREYGDLRSNQEVVQSSCKSAHRHD